MRKVRPFATCSCECWVETLSSKARFRLLKESDWEIREAAFYLNDYEYYDETFHLEPPLGEVDEVCGYLIQDLLDKKLKTPYTVAGVDFLTRLPVQVYIQWAQEYWHSYFPDKEMPNIVVAYQEQAKCSVEPSTQVQYLKERGVPVVQLLDLMRRVYDFSREPNGGMKTTSAIRELPEFKELSSAQNLHKQYPDLPSTKLLDVVIRILRNGEKSSSSKG